MNVIRFSRGRLYYLDQTRLPLKEVWLKCDSAQDAFTAIKKLRVRGAPLIGVFAAYGLYVAVKDLPEKNSGVFVGRLKNTAIFLNSSRPTAVNLSWALRRVVAEAVAAAHRPVKEIKQIILDQVLAIHQQDILMCERIGKFGASLVKNNDVILTHCNAGALATAGQGTALAVIYAAARAGKKIKVFADETRPLLQGARLTAWELKKEGIDVILICDNMAAYLMQQGRIDKVFVGADRITANGDFANKIGTYGVAVSAAAHNVPFYVAAPFSTFDLSLSSGRDIPIECRDADEVRRVCGKVFIAPADVKVYNPAFDVTPHRLVAAFVTDKGIIKPDFKDNITRVFKNNAR